ncbi:MAG: hypothetical protein JAY97_07895 [Candidatus Thiodiazotropha sp. 'RUGA']|nr:hypothetical protein [Candidatus Thiodiazotropha sp. 'RUGA']
MELKKIAQIAHVTWSSREKPIRLGIETLFIIGTMLCVGSTDTQVSHMLTIVAMIGSYMAMNTGANDIGPAVASHAITPVGAITIAAALLSIAQGAKPYVARCCLKTH